MAAHVRESGSTSHLPKFSEYRVTGYGVAFATEIALAKDEIRLHWYIGLLCLALCESPRII